MSKKKERKKVEYKTKEERQGDVKNIIKELSKFELTPTYEPVKELYKKKHFNLKNLNKDLTLLINKIN